MYLGVCYYVCLLQHVAFYIDISRKHACTLMRLCSIRLRPGIKNIAIDVSLNLTASSRQIILKVDFFNWKEQLTNVSEAVREQNRTTLLKIYLCQK